jgi:hypothetical protein
MHVRVLNDAMRFGREDILREMQEYAEPGS